MLRYTLGANISARLVSAFHDQPNDTSRRKMLAKTAGVSLSTVGRIIDCETGASLDNIEHIARALGCSVIDLLTPSEDQLRALGVGKR